MQLFWTFSLLIRVRFHLKSDVHVMISLFSCMQGVNSSYITQRLMNKSPFLGKKIPIGMCVCVCACTCVCMYVCMCICVCAYVCACVCENMASGFNDSYQCKESITANILMKNMRMGCFLGMKTDYKVSVIEEVWY